MTFSMDLAILNHLESSLLSINQAMPRLFLQNKGWVQIKDI